MQRLSIIIKIQMTKNDKLTSVRAVVHGRVQGVFFRAFVAEKSTELGVTGYVRNLQDGTSVEVKAEGERDKLERLLGYLRIGPHSARVDKLSADWSEYTGSYPDFRVKH